MHAEFRILRMRDLIQLLVCVLRDLGVAGNKAVLEKLVIQDGAQVYKAPLPMAPQPCGEPFVPSA